MAGVPCILNESGKFGMLICYDIYFPEAARILALKKARLILVSSADWKPLETVVRRFIPSRALENNLHIVYVNRAGVEGDYHYFGESCIANPKGDIICRLSDREGFLVKEIDVGETQPPELSTFCLENRRPDIYDPLQMR